MFPGNGVRLLNFEAFPKIVKIITTDINSSFIILLIAHDQFLIDSLLQKKELSTVLQSRAAPLMQLITLETNSRSFKV